jgi:hypothetical protein
MKTVVGVGPKQVQGCYLWGSRPVASQVAVRGDDGCHLQVAVALVRIVESAERGGLGGACANPYPLHGQQTAQAQSCVSADQDGPTGAEDLRIDQGRRTAQDIGQRGEAELAVVAVQVGAGPQGGKSSHKVMLRLRATAELFVRGQGSHCAAPSVDPFWGYTRRHSFRS